ncbi:phosphoheptose isomerase [Sporomusaceae bacterium FL31]|nr:phosphoheptose isomerase [Sporomusaceae bacterium FL31]GCE33919.1 phosphoheptose isomerase [Sporomusaceae bacterium]
MPFNRIIQEHIQVIETLAQTCITELDEAAKICSNALANGHTLYFCGNGGSAADCQHLAAEFVGRFVKERRGLPSIALTTDTSILTAVGNDYGYDQVFARQVDALVREGDVVFGLSTSGNSRNVVLALQKAKELGAVTVGMTGKNGGQVAETAAICLKAPSSVTARIQEAHILLGHMLCEYIDEVSSDVQEL